MKWCWRVTDAESYVGGQRKPTDAVIVGIYNEYSDEPAENAELVRRYGA